MFFALGRQVRQFPYHVMRLLELGHIVGNHSDSHLRLTDSSVTDESACAEFTAAAAELGQLGVDRPFFRPPYGAWNSHLAHVFNSHPSIRLSGTGPVNWEIDGGDYLFWRDQKSTDACANSYTAAVRQQNRGIVLFHEFSADDHVAASRNKTFEMVRLLIPRLRDMGYRFSPASEVPELKAVSNMGLRCALRAANGRYARADGRASNSLRATAHLPVGDAALRLFAGGKGSVRLESADGITLCPQIEILPLSGNQAAFRTPDGLFLACDPLTFEIKPTPTKLNERATFHLTMLGVASPGGASRSEPPINQDIASRTSV